MYMLNGLHVLTTHCLINQLFSLRAGEHVLSKSELNFSQTGSDAQQDPRYCCRKK